MTSNLSIVEIFVLYKVSCIMAQHGQDQLSRLTISAIRLSLAAVQASLGTAAITGITHVVRASTRTGIPAVWAIHVRWALCWKCWKC